MRVHSGRIFHSSQDRINSSTPPELCETCGEDPRVSPVAIQVQALQACHRLAARRPPVQGLGAWVGFSLNSPRLHPNNQPLECAEKDRVKNAHENVDQQGNQGEIAHGEK